MTADDPSRAQRMRAYDDALAEAAKVIAVLGAVVRARESRGWREAQPPEVVFAQAGESERALSAAVWVALRGDDTRTVLDALQEASVETFLIAKYEELGEGYRLQTVEETKPLPNLDLLVRQLSVVLEIPVDVLGVLGRWGLDDPRTAGEVNALLDSRFGASGADAAGGTLTDRGRVTARGASDDGGAGGPGATPVGTAEVGLTMSVQETADVLQLTAAQAKVLETLVRRAGVRITP